MVQIRAKLFRYLSSALILWLMTGFLASLQAVDKADMRSLGLNGQKNTPDVSVPVFAEISHGTLSAGSQFTIRIVGRIDSDSHLYSVKPQGEFAPKPTELVVTNGFLSAVSSASESPTVLVIDDAFDIPLKVHKNDFWISRRYLVKQDTKPGLYRVEGFLRYQICSFRICSLPLKSHFEEKIVVSKR